MKLSLVARALFIFYYFSKRKQYHVCYSPWYSLLRSFRRKFLAAYNLNQYILTHSASRVSYFGWAAAIFHLTKRFRASYRRSYHCFYRQKQPRYFKWISRIISSGRAHQCANCIYYRQTSVSWYPSIFPYHHIWEHQRTKNWKLVLDNKDFWVCTMSQSVQSREFYCMSF